MKHCMKINKIQLHALQVAIWVSILIIREKEFIETRNKSQIIL